MKAMRILFWVVVIAVSSRFGLGFGVIALAVSILDLRGTARWEQQKDGKYRHPNEQALYNKFGRWTPVLQYGPLALFAVVSMAARQTRTPFLTRLSWILLLVFFGVGLYLCWVIAAAKHSWNEPDEENDKED